MKKLKAIQNFHFRGRDVLVEDLLFLLDDEATELIETGSVVELPLEQPHPDVPPLPPVESSTESSQK